MPVIRTESPSPLTATSPTSETMTPEAITPTATAAAPNGTDNIQSYLSNPVISATTVVTKNEEQIYKCPLCQEDFLSQKDFTNHIRAHNEVKPSNDPNDPTGQAKVYYCSLCGKMLSSFSSLDRHMLVHSGERPFSCELCGQTFTTNGNMHRHKRTHSAKELSEFYEANGGVKSSGRRGGRKRKAGTEANGKKALKDSKKNVANGKEVPMDEIGGQTVPPALPPFPDFSGVMSKLFYGSKPLPFLPTSSITSSHAALIPPVTATTSTVFPNSPDFAQHLFPQLAKAIQPPDEAANNSGKPLSAFTTTAPGNAYNSPFTSSPTSLVNTLTATRAAAAATRRRGAGKSPATPAATPAAGLHDQLHNSALKCAVSVSQMLPLQPVLNVQNDNTNNDDCDIAPNDMSVATLTTAPSEDGDDDDDDDKDLADVQSIISVTRTSGLNNNEGSKDGDKSDLEDGDEEGLLPVGSQDDNDPLIKDMKLKGEFPCRLCPAVYPNLRALKGHNKEHLTKAPYSCNVGRCEYSSSDKSTLARHMRTHTGEKPFECKLCNYGFTTKANCERHLKNKHGKTGRDTIRENLIIHETDEPDPNTLHKMHMEAHREGTGDYRCKVCKQHFETSDKVIGHAVVAHPAYQNDVDHIFEIMKGPKSKEAKAAAAANDLGGAPSMVPRVSAYPPLSQLRPILPSQNKSRQAAAQTASPTLAAEAETAETKEAEDNDDDAPLDLSFPSKAPSSASLPPLQPVAPTLSSLMPPSFGLPNLPLSHPPPPNLSPAATAALTAANLDPALCEQMYKNAVAMAMPLMLPAGGPVSMPPRLQFNPQAVAAAAAAISGGFPLSFPQFLPPTSAATTFNMEGLEAEIKRRMQLQQQQQHHQAQAAQAAALAALGILKSGAGAVAGGAAGARHPRPPLPFAVPPVSVASLAPNDVTAFISAQREILRKQHQQQQQGKPGGGGATFIVTPSPLVVPSAASLEVGASSNEMKDEPAEEAATKTPPPPPPPLTRKPDHLFNGGERQETEQEREGGADSGGGGSGSLGYSDDESNYKMVIKNGVLMKKQKQRRYRTERPYGCDHCSARFTLRSNMERHIKQQHPEHWLSKPRGGRRNNSVTVPVLAPHLIQQGTTSKETRMEEEEEEEECVDIDENGTEVGIVEDDSETGGEEGGTGIGGLVIDEPGKHNSSVKSGDETGCDLASVSNMINTASNNAFKDFLDRKGGDVIDLATEDDANEDDDNSLTLSSPEQKKASAYSAAPHKIPCTYCDRKFPWMSSLNRHLLTHTGSKPHKCRTCPLWFTTKSNCDRHQQRKHGTTTESSGDSSYSLDLCRKTPERPYKCQLCPSTSFSTKDNLRKHNGAKHEGFECTGDADCDGDDEDGSDCDVSYEQEERENEDEERELVHVENGSLVDEDEEDRDDADNDGEDEVNNPCDDEAMTQTNGVKIPPPPPLQRAPMSAIAGKKRSLMDTIAKLSGSAIKL
jgi:uncharacterized Zn-finger protein